ncbi:alpha/beta hydrolase [Porphyromonadaceae bacterium OttesenSCG-928-L07]|nr:alpha/beta hydrolase [Porphyromonadaceae bacterium OttesenSCG-928-L07]MDL2251992.1 alpha/beta hydrolase [Odoribacter sp. OttesenSCG-928-J03]MDL2330824.1 alpha/beta hydrolase [Odoribacter sp. OttesenSCG-928-A06]
MIKLLLLGAVLLLFYPRSLYSHEGIKIWDGTDEKAKRVTLTAFLPEEGDRNTAVIICPGGSYFWLDYETEGVKVAHWLKESGIAAFVLKYRTAGVPAFVSGFRNLWPGNQHPDMIRDLQRSIQVVRERSEEFNIHHEQLGVMGFSAGGHLVMTSAIYHRTNFLSELNITPTCSLRPDFVASIYPVVTLSNESYVHKRSRKGLLGEKNMSDKRLCDSLSLEMNIPEDCPPVFLLHCEDDPIVKYQNSVLLDSALTAKNITHEFVLYKTGGHGFGADHNKGTEECRVWKESFLNWLKTLFKYENGYRVSVTASN